MLSHYRDKIAFRILIHVLVWILLLLLPFLLTHSGNESMDYAKMMRMTWVPMFFYAVIFYLNYLLLIERLLFKRKQIVFIAINLFLILFFIWIHFEIRDFLNMISEIKPENMLPNNGGGPKHKPPMQLFIYRDAISMIIPAIFAFAIKTTEKWSKTEAEKKENEKEILNSELQHLKYQLQPHFFFNSLNTIYALIERSPSLAQETVHSLAKLMRYMLYETESGKTNLNEEIDFMKQYIDLMKLRISDKTSVETDLPVLTQKIEITPFLFISLIENAFKHGVSATQASEIKFSLNVEKNKISFLAVNTNFPKNEKDKSGSGIGLNNLKKRLELSYPGKYHFETQSENKLYSVRLEINLD